MKAVNVHVCFFQQLFSMLNVDEFILFLFCLAWLVVMKVEQVKAMKD